MIPLSTISPENRLAQVGSSVSNKDGTNVRTGLNTGMNGAGSHVVLEFYQ